MTIDNQFAEYADALREFIRNTSTSVPARGQPSAPVDEVRFNELALALFARQFEHNTPYRKFCEARHATPAKVKDWPQIPAIPTTAFKELELTSLPVRQRTAVFCSSGTTGQTPSRHFHNAASLANYEASLLPWYAAHLLADGDAPRGVSGRTVSAAAASRETEKFPETVRQPARRKTGSFALRMISLTPDAIAAPHSSLVHMLEAVRHEFGAPDSVFVGATDRASAWTLNTAAALRALDEAVAASSAVVLLGTAFSFAHLLDYLEGQRQRYPLPPGSRVMETGGYKGRGRALPKSELHARLTDRLGVLADFIVCEYGMSELSSQAYDHIAGRLRNAKLEARLFQFPPWARGQIVSPETGREVADGETGLIRVFDLSNVRSVLAVQTEDLGVRRGAGFELIGRAAAAEPRGCSLMTR